MRLMTWKAASALEAGRDAKKEAYLAKLYAGEMTMKLTDFGVQILGASIAIIPILIVFILASRQFMAGLTAGAVK